MTETHHLTLADKPRDLLVSLVDDGPQTSAELSRRFGNGSVHSGGLVLLHELGLARGPRNEHDQRWAATDEGRSAVAEARGAAERPPLTFAEVAEQSRARAERWHGQDSEPWSGADWSNAMCGEAGEAANVVKKLRRLETAITQGTYNGESVTTTDRDELVEKLGDEIADVILYADLLAAHYGIDVEQHVRDKFNRVSIAQGFPERL